jgi:hypothetical protein
MNQKQKTVLFCTAVVVGLMVLLPPYVVMNYKQVVIKSGYGFLFYLPQYVSTTSKAVIPATVNVATLLIQILAVLVVGGLVYSALKK